MTIQQFDKKKPYLVCVDSDGCVMDTMDVKHKKCFGPCLVEEWGLQAHRERVLARWNQINLYERTRGINRFKGLLAILREIDAAICPVEGLYALQEWVQGAAELSNDALQREIQKNPAVCLVKALNWSRRLNGAIDALDDGEKTAFDGAAQTLARLHRYADIAVVSSANGAAVEEEWKRLRLLAHTDILLTQEAGSKARCIAQMKDKGYAQGRVLMVGDAVGDYEAAERNGVFFFPVLVRKESQSWRELGGEGLERFLAGTFGGAYAQALAARFFENFG